MRKLKKILLLLICVVFIMGEMPVSFAYAQEEMLDELEATQEEKDNEETKEEKEENQNQQEDDEDTGNADADSDKDLDAEPDEDEASEEAAEESENPEDFDGVDWTAENTQQITAPGTYTIYVRDAVENVGRYEIELLYDPEPEDDKGGGKGWDNPQPVNPPEQLELPEQPKEDTSGDGGNENLIPQPPLPKEPVKAEIFELAVPEVEPELKLPHSPKVKKKKADTMTEIVVDSSCAEGAGHEKLLQAAVMTGAATSGGIILYFALFFIIPAAHIYELRGKKRKYLGTKLLLRRKVDLRKLFEKTEESLLMIKINWLYAKYNAGKKLSCIKGQDIEEKDVQAIMIVYR